VDGIKKTAIVRFKEISSAQTVFTVSREMDPETGKRR